MHLSQNRMPLGTTGEHTRGALWPYE
jgi:hypothetical protein